MIPYGGCCSIALRGVRKELYRLTLKVKGLKPDVAESPGIALTIIDI